MRIRNLYQVMFPPLNSSADIDYALYDDTFFITPGDALKTLQWWLENYLNHIHPLYFAPGDKKSYLKNISIIEINETGITISADIWKKESKKIKKSVIHNGEKYFKYENAPLEEVFIRNAKCKIKIKGTEFKLADCLDDETKLKYTKE